MNEYLGALKKVNKNEAGSTTTWLIVAVVFIVTTIGLGVGLTFALMNYFDQKDNVDTKVPAAVTSAVKEQADKDAATFEAEEKKPTRLFSGPEDYGALTFEYPKTWSMYVANDAINGGDYQAYFHPIAIPNISDSVQYALRVKISTTDYDGALSAYSELVKGGKVSSSVVKINGVDATRFDGSFTDDTRGSVLILKIRDKIVTISSDAQTFNKDFDDLIKTIKFNI